VLASAADDELAGQQFETVRSKKAKRTRNRTDSAENEEILQLQQRQPLLAQNAPARRGRNLLVFGKSADRSSIFAAHGLSKRRLFSTLITSIKTAVLTTSFHSFVKGVDVDVISCFEVKPRRRHANDPCDDRKAFRLCINNDDRKRMLDSSLWPNYVSVLKWFFMPQSTKDDGQQAADKRRRIDGNNIGRTVETIRRPGGASDLADASAFVRESSDDTIIAALDHHSADDAGCAEGGSCEETIIEMNRSAIVNGGC